MLHVRKRVRSPIQSMNSTPVTVSRNRALVRSQLTYPCTHKTFSLDNDGRTQNVPRGPVEEAWKVGSEYSLVENRPHDAWLKKFYNVPQRVSSNALNWLFTHPRCPLWLQFRWDDLVCDSRSVLYEFPISPGRNSKGPLRAIFVRLKVLDNPDTGGEDHIFTFCGVVSLITPNLYCFKQLTNVRTSLTIQTRLIGLFSIDAIHSLQTQRDHFV
jgi:hypothetical protein